MGKGNLDIELGDTDLKIELARRTEFDYVDECLVFYRRGKNKLWTGLRRFRKVTTIRGSLVAVGGQRRAPDELDTGLIHPVNQRVTITLNVNFCDYAGSRIGRGTGDATPSAD